MMIEHLENGCFLSGPAGRLPVREDDEITRRVAMLYEGQCQGLTVVRSKPQARDAVPLSRLFLATID